MVVEKGDGDVGILIEVSACEDHGWNEVDKRRRMIERALGVQIQVVEGEVGATNAI